MNHQAQQPICPSQVTSLAEAESPQDRAVRLILANGKDVETMVRFAYIMGRFESAAMNFDDVLENVRERR